MSKMPLSEAGAQPYLAVHEPNKSKSGRSRHARYGSRALFRRFYDRERRHHGGAAGLDLPHERRRGPRAQASDRYHPGRAARTARNPRSRLPGARWNDLGVYTVCSGSRLYTGRFHPRGHHHGREPDARAPRAGRSDAVVLTEWRHEGPLRTIASPGRGARPCSGDSDRLIFRIGRRSLARRLPRSSIPSRIRMRRTRAAQRRRARVLANPKNPSVATPCPQSTIRLRDRRGVATAVDPSTPSRARCSTMVVHPMPPRRRELLLQVRNYVPLAAVGLIATVTWVVLV